MSTLVIEGGRSLSGSLEVEGNKNAALPLLAACLLTDQLCVLHNVPRIRDVQAMAELLSRLGARIDGLGSTTLRVQCASLANSELDPALAARLRGSVLLLAPLLARQGRATVWPSGGDFPARRTISTHLQALQAMGARLRPGDPVQTLEVDGGLSGASIYLEEASVTGTETAILAAACARGATQIRHAACEPHVVELCRFLSKMGARIEGEGTSTIRIEGAARLGGTEHRLHGDYVEVGSWAVVAAVTGSSLDIRGARAVDMEPIGSALRRMAVQCWIDDGRVRVEPSRPAAVRRITTGLWPGFPSDMVSLIAVLATQAEGRTLIHDWMYELRLFALEQLSAMYADLFLCDPHRIIVTGPTRLYGRTLDTRDLRSGMALIAAALAAEGESRIAPLETVERGYADVVRRLRSLGARVAVED